MNEIEKTIETLEAFNKWRRDDEGEFECPDVKEIGIAIDDACDLLKQHIKLKEELKKAVNECIKLTKTVNEMITKITLYKVIK